MHCNTIENMKGTDTLNEKGSVKENIPLISVVIPVFNAENYIERCLESVTHSTFIVNVINLFTMQKSTVKQVSHSARRKS